MQTETRIEAQAFNQLFASVRYSGDRHIIGANPAFARLFSVPLKTLLGQTDDVFRPQQASSNQDWWAGLLANKQSELRWRDSDRRWFLSRFLVIGSNDGNDFEVIEAISEISASKQVANESARHLAAFERGHFVMRCTLDGVILEINDLFLGALGFTREEIVGRPLSSLLEMEARKAARLNTVFSSLAQGEDRTGEYQLQKKGGSTIWLKSVFSPVMDDDGNAQQILLHATDITATKTLQADFQSQIVAIQKSNVVVTFDMFGTILDANTNFLEATGYTLEEIVGRHHKIFVETSYAHGVDYASFWNDLRQGKHRSGLYKRFGRDGREIWLQATYNPIFDPDGKPSKVVKYASVVTEEKLLQAEHQGQIAAINKAQCVISFDLSGHILDANENFLSATGYRFSEVRGQHHSMFLYGELADSREYAQFWTDLARGEHKSGEYCRQRKDGSELWLQATYNPIKDMSGRTFKVVKYATDITAEKLLRGELQGQIAAIQRSQGIAFFDLSGTIVDMNDNLLTVLGYRLDEVQGRHHSKLVGREVAESVEYEAFWSGLRSGSYQSGLHKRIGKDGREVWLQCSYNPIFDLAGRPTRVMKIATDVSANVALAEAFEDAKRQAQHDIATSLPNRAKLASFMSSFLTSPGGSMVVFYIDLDRFKPVNDTHGHHVGDRVLGEVADRLRRSIREDQLVARVGGDEFVIAAPGMTTEAIDTFCARLYEVVTAPIHHDAGEITIGMSMGIAIAPMDGSTPDELLRAADTALYRSKQSGRGHYSFFSSEMNDKINARRRLAEDMRHSLSAGEFFLEYQPRFDTRARKLRSVEALVRWAHPERGRISPVEFIPLAEQSGLIIPLGDWVLRTACETAVKWDGIGVSVNVSPVQFRDPLLVQKVVDCLKTTGLAPELLELEITEGVLLDDANRANEILRSLKDLGVRLAMDDFGTGYSSLSYLRNFPFDVIKIDRSFITDLESSDGARPIVQAILGLGKALGLSVTAEGVETNEQLALLTADHCEEVQGFLLARPLHPSQIDEIVSEIPEVATRMSAPHRLGDKTGSGRG